MRSSYRMPSLDGNEIGERAVAHAYCNGEHPEEDAWAMRIWVDILQAPPAVLARAADDITSQGRYDGASLIERARRQFLPAE
jgi:hypothetical protein